MLALPSNRRKVDLITEDTLDKLNNQPLYVQQYHIVPA